MVKYINKIEPINKKQVWLDGDEITFLLPSNVVDLKSFKVYYSAYIDPKYRYATPSTDKRTKTKDA